MCLAVPGEILSITIEDEFSRTGKVSFGGIIKQINLTYVPEAAVGDYVIVHAGFALNTIDAEEAKKVFEYLEQLQEDELAEGE